MNVEVRHAWLFVEHHDDVVYSRVSLGKDVMKRRCVVENRSVRSGMDGRLRELVAFVKGR